MGLSCNGINLCPDRRYVVGHCGPAWPHVAGLARCSIECARALFKVVRSNVEERVPQKRLLVDLDDATTELFLRRLDPPFSLVPRLMNRLLNDLVRSGQQGWPVTKLQISEFMEERNLPYH